MTEKQEFNFKFNDKNIETIIDALKDLAKIDTMIKMKLDKEHVLFYSKAGKDNNIHALKSFIFPIEDFITVKDNYITIDFIILNGLNFVKNLDLLQNKGEISGKLVYEDKAKIANMLYIKAGNIKLNFITGDYRQIKDLSKGDIENKMNPDNANFSFDITNDQFTEIKKLTTLNKSEIISIRAKNKKLEFFDTRWSNYICDLNVDDENWSFSNKFFKSIISEGDIKLHMFDAFVLFKEKNVSLMIGLELGEFK